MVSDKLEIEAEIFKVTYGKVDIGLLLTGGGEEPSSHIGHFSCRCSVEFVEGGDVGATQADPWALAPWLLAPGASCPAAPVRPAACLTVEPDSSNATSLLAGTTYRPPFLEAVNAQNNTPATVPLCILPPVNTTTELIARRYLARPCSDPPFVVLNLEPLA